jgi:hypothetical protein
MVSNADLGYVQQHVPWKSSMFEAAVVLGTLDVAVRPRFRLVALMSESGRVTWESRSA